jgi:hypothetical protein
MFAKDGRADQSISGQIPRFRHHNLGNILDIHHTSVCLGDGFTIGDFSPYPMK